MGFIRKYMSKPRKEHRIVIKRVFKYLCDTIYYASYFHERIELDRVIDVHGFSNVDWARYIDHKRYTSGMFNLFGAINGMEKRQGVVSLPIAGVEYMGSTHASKEFTWL
jgi:hypothetical protein